MQLSVCHAAAHLLSFHTPHHNRVPGALPLHPPTLQAGLSPGAHFLQRPGTLQADDRVRGGRPGEEDAGGAGWPGGMKQVMPRIGEGSQSPDGVTRQRGMGRRKACAELCCEACTSFVWCGLSSNSPSLLVTQSSMHSCPLSPTNTSMPYTHPRTLTVS